MGIFGKPPDAKPTSITPPVPPNRPAPPPAAPAAAPVSAPVAHAPAAAPVSRGGATCVIGAKTVIKGEISGDEDVVVEGNVEGEIHVSRDLRVGPGGLVKAAVSAQSIIVSGEIVGDCEAVSRVEIQSTGRLTGNIRAPKIVIAEGAMFRGNSDMSARREDRKDKLAIS
jgi:cytoskeletal protein CcmA (bactofilin family)